MARLSEGPKGEPKTASGRSYWANARRSADLIKSLIDSAEALAAEIEALPHPDGLELPVDVSDEISSRFDQIFEGQRLLHEWQVVMAVTFAEAFLHDVLVECACVTPSFLASSDLKIPITEIAKSADLMELKLSSYSRWARSFVDDGGPKRWSARLTGLGVRDLPADLEPLEEAWGIRHIVVHRASVVSGDFCSRHPRFGLSSGQYLNLNSGHVIEYVELIDAFVRPIDESFATLIAAKGADAV